MQGKENAKKQDVIAHGERAQQTGVAKTATENETSVEDYLSPSKTMV